MKLYALSLGAGLLDQPVERLRIVEVARVGAVLLDQARSGCLAPAHRGTTPAAPAAHPTAIPISTRTYPFIS